MSSAQEAKMPRVFSVIWVGIKGARKRKGIVDENQQTNQQAKEETKEEEKTKKALS